MDTFEVDLSALDKIAAQDLPAIATALRGIANVVTTHEGLEGPGHLDAVYAMEGAYAHFTDSVGNRQRIACDRIDATANALRDVVNLYRRADGQA
ncbi:hypothetical protein [Actinocrispum wychmicini]|nr:hypothetical protein [Actinocrispum wychmicini]